MPTVRNAPLRARSVCNDRSNRQAIATHVRSALVVTGPPAEALDVRAAALAGQPLLAGRRRRRRRPPRPLHPQRLTELVGEPLERELAVSELAALVLRDGAHDGPRTLRDAAALRLAQRLRCGHVEDS